MAGRVRVREIDGDGGRLRKDPDRGLEEQGGMIPRHMSRRNRHADDQRLCAVVTRANVA
ncbi:hypothetical protein ACPCAB_20720 [Streptomyces koyangensis]|uniref:hypothetical protein n=1 Tax=Streptomyces TaxID=1883 RepID=UPI0013EF1AB7|nr:hypothetical protein [Streptomyces sp. SCA2-2]